MTRALSLLARGAVITAVAAVLLIAWRSGLLGLEDMAKLRMAIARAREFRGLAPVFVVAYAILAAAGVPASPLTLAGGALFGFRAGVVVNWLGALLGALLAFAAVRVVTRRRVARSVASTPMHLFRLRLIPVVPFSLLNVASAMSTMTFRAFFAATALGIIPITVIYTMFAASLVAGVEGAGRRALVTALLSAAVIIAITLVPRFTRRWAPMLLLAVLPGALRAQTAGDLSAFSALMVSPTGALPPRAFDNGSAMPERGSIALRYGGWRYDVDDGDHLNFGLTATHRLGASRSSISVTGAYLALDCACSVWASGGASLRTLLWMGAGHLAVEMAAGAARYSGEGHAKALAGSIAADLGFGLPVRGGRLAFSLLPGIGYGHLASVDESGGGSRPMIGAAASWMLPRGVSLDVGMQRIVLSGGPTQVGGGISWHAR